MPEITQGTTGYLIPDGTSAPTAGRDWEILKSGIVIAWNGATAGWSVTKSGGLIAVTTPGSAFVATDYQVKVNFGALVEVPIGYDPVPGGGGS